ncbi:beta-1,4-glucuronyltransferase 1-like [Copidosoma floridanum]|uniref:beta-1,4-glucuronyltransferase 1-like n=1 Tax=Copidosoma floridanum TaxID=29053 RepID=UPI0006C9D5BA|nr:beta-1,4-glucuronyltransferase 1-like [Copidosoma floridanum]
MRRWRRYAGLGLCACWLPLAIRLLLLGRGYVEPSLALINGPAIGRDGDSATGARVDRRLAQSTPAFVGAYMAERQPANVSYCRWQYELPESLVYLDYQLIGSPEAGPTGGPNGVLPFAIRGSQNAADLPPVTLCSHATADQVYSIVELAKRWEGPLSLSVFVPGHDLGLAVRLLDLACHCEPAMSKVSVHFIFPRNEPPSLEAPPSAADLASPDRSCGAADLQRKTANSTDRHRLGLLYPINVARNVARSLAPTQRVLVSDIELLPSEHLASQFAAMLKGRTPKRAIAFVLPVFEIEARLAPPANKKQLLVALRTGNAVYFHRFLCPHCQRFPGIETRWILRPDPGKVRPLIITRREYPNNRWEPIFIGTKHDPFYAEDMTWEGRQDKMTQMFEMCLMNYRLIILDGAFLVHTPGIKRKPFVDGQQPRVDERQRAHERRNARIYQRITRRLLKRYPVNNRCKS